MKIRKCRWRGWTRRTSRSLSDFPSLSLLGNDYAAPHSCMYQSTVHISTGTLLVLLITAPSGTYITGAQAAQPILLLRILPRLSALRRPGMRRMNPDLQASSVISNMPESRLLSFPPLVRAQFQFFMLLFFHLFCLYNIQT